VPKRIISKYDSNGEIAWHVEEILDARRSESDGVEFQVKCASLTGIHSYQRSGFPSETSWESTSALNNWQWRSLIVRFYHIKPKAYGKQEVVDAWKLRDMDSGMDESMGRAAAMKLTSIIEREAAMEEQREAQKREAAKKAKKAKKMRKMKKMKTVVNL
jgi:hypothetical protein